MTIKQVEIDLNYRIDAIEAQRVLKALLTEEDLSMITFQAVKTREAGVPTMGEEIEAARKLRVTTADLPPETADGLTSRIMRTAEKCSLGTLALASLFDLEAAPNLPRITTE